MNPYCRFVDGGRQYICPICQCSNEGEVDSIVKCVISSNCYYQFLRSIFHIWIILVAEWISCNGRNCYMEQWSMQLPKIIAKSGYFWLLLGYYQDILLGGNTT